jgi:polar amino acid transport system substrate-binding protein
MISWQPSHFLVLGPTGFRALLAGLLVLTMPAAGRDLVIATSSSIPPYVITDQHRGIVVEILQEALLPRGHQIEFVYAPNRRVEHMIEERQVDGVYNLAAGSLDSVHYSDAIIDYHNVAITLADAPRKIDSLASLKDLRVVVFQNAPKFLGPEFLELISDGHDFPEVSNQRSQVLMLFRKRADVIIMERRIFEYFHNQLRSSGEIGGGYRIHTLFPPAPRYAAFIDKDIRDQFNAGLRKLKDSGRLQAIIERYLGTSSKPE